MNVCLSADWSAGHDDFGGEKKSLKFLKVNWTKKRGIVALLATALVVTSFFLGGYMATGRWLPWGNRHYYQVLNANFQECYTPASGGSTQCQTTHNTIFNASAVYVQKVVESGTGALCTVGAACSFNFIALSNNTVLPNVSETSIGATNGQCGGAGQGGGVNQAGTEWATRGLQAQSGAVTNIPATGGGTGAGSPSTIVKQFTVATTASPVSQSCLVNESSIDANRVNLAAATFTSITLQPGDQITITWTLNWSWS